MLTNPIAFPESVPMDTMGNVEPTVVRMMTVCLLPRDAHTSAREPVSTHDVKGVLRVSLPYTHTAREVADEMMRASTKPHMATHVRWWLGLTATSTSEQKPVSGRTVQLYVEDPHADSNSTLVPVAPATHLEDMVSTARSVNGSSDLELTMFYASENALGCNYCAAMCYCCAACACCAACCAE